MKEGNLVKKKNKKKYIHFVILFSIIILNLFLISNIIKSNLHGSFETSKIESNYENNNETSTHLRYISEETIESLNENSKWLTDDELRELLEETLEKNPEDVDGYIVKK